jgi:hypothetical protein
MLLHVPVTSIHPLGAPSAGTKRATCIDCLRSRGAVKADSLPACTGMKAIKKVALAALQHARSTGRPLQGPASTARKPLKKVSINAIASGCAFALLHERILPQGMAALRRVVC